MLPLPEPAEVEIASAAGDSEDADSGKAEETVEEIRFYLAHGMPEQAMAALAKFQTLTRDQAKIAELRAEVEAATQTAEEEASAASEPVMEELTADDIPTIEVEVEEPPVAEPPAVVEAHAVAAPEPAAAPELPWSKRLLSLPRCRFKLHLPPWFTLLLPNPSRNPVF